ncbi:hypothetical protein K435DRAFT_880198 [Dendrothele bispora CBS 962.96]|nr:hypothetical protein K435DRAFT_880198 [Dendrothele bispora CBS 962.96]
MTLDRKGTTKDDYTTVGLKGIIGISAMARISAALGFSNDSEIYLSNATSFIQDWQTKTVKSDHITMEFKDEESFALLYDLYADTLLGTNLVDQTVYETHESFCQSSLSSKKYPFGIPVSSYISETKSMWSMFTAATLKNNQTRDNLIHSMFARATFNQSSQRNFPLIYDSASGLSQPAEGANPQQGGMFALLALGASRAIDTKTTGSPTSGPSKSQTKAGKIVGIVIGSVGTLALIMTATFFFWRRKNLLAQKHLAVIPNVFQAEPLGDEEVERGERPRLSRSHFAKGTNHSSTSPSSSPEQPQLETTQLRNDLINLRREMEEMRAQGYYETMPPPQYIAD